LLEWLSWGILCCFLFAVGIEQKCRKVVSAAAIYQQSEFPKGSSGDQKCASPTYPRRSTQLRLSAPYLVGKCFPSRRSRGYQCCIWLVPAFLRDVSLCTKFRNVFVTSASDACMLLGLSTSSSGGPSMAAVPAPVCNSEISAGARASGGQCSYNPDDDDDDDYEQSSSNWNHVSRVPPNRPVLRHAKASSRRPSAARSSSAGGCQSRIEKVALDNALSDKAETCNGPTQTSRQTKS
jgi:hypothetical protein